MCEFLVVFYYFRYCFGYKEYSDYGICVVGFIAFIVQFFSVGQGMFIVQVIQLEYLVVVFLLLWRFQREEEGYFFWCFLVVFYVFLWWFELQFFFQLGILFILGFWERLKERLIFGGFRLKVTFVMEEEEVGFVLSWSSRIVMKKIMRRIIF